MWRLANSWWLLLIVFSFGWFAWAAFAWVGARARHRTWLYWAGFYFVVTAVFFALLAVNAAQVLAGGIFFLLWAGSSLHGLLIRREVLERLGFQEHPRLMSARSRALQRDVAEELARRSPQVALEAGVGQDADTFGGLIDINHAPADELARLPGFDEALADEIVKVREEVGGFDSVLDFATVLDLSPDLMPAVRERTVCLPR